jgi:hypothetical protein
VTGRVTGTTLNVTGLSITGDPNAKPCLLKGMTVTGGTLPAGTTITFDLGIPNNSNNLGNYTLSNAPVTSGDNGPFTASMTMWFLPHPAPRFTVIGCTGGKTVTDMAGAPLDSPIYSYCRRAFEGFPPTAINPQPYIPLMGNLVSWEVDVQKVYTGAVTGAYNCTIFMFGIAKSGNNYYPTFVSQVINLKTPGTRTITASGTLGAQTGDNMVAVPFWLTGGHLVVITPKAAGDRLAVMPRIVMTAKTKQGIEFATITLNTTTFGTDILADTIPWSAL